MSSFHPTWIACVNCVPPKVSEATTAFPCHVASAAYFGASRCPPWPFFLLVLFPRGLGAYLHQLLSGGVAGVITCCNTRLLENHLGRKNKEVEHLSKAKMWWRP